MFDPPVEDEKEYDEEDEWDPPMEPAQVKDQFPQEYEDPDEDA